MSSMRIRLAVLIAAVAQLGAALALAQAPTTRSSVPQGPASPAPVQPDVVARWAANAPLTMVHQYVPQLRGYTALALDAGDTDFGIVDTVRALDRILTEYGVEHSAEVYQGDHVNRVDQRLETKVLPFFSAHLAFQ